jgi:two-component system, NtrC family, response regulator
MPKPLKILVCDDDQAIRSSLKFLLAKAGYEVDCAATPEEIIQKIRNSDFSLVLLDMNYSMNISGEEGLELLQKIKIFQPGIPVILMTAWGSVELAVQGMKLGATDFVTKPWSNLQLLKVIDTSITLSEGLAGTNKETRGFNQDAKLLHGIVGNDPKLKELLNIISQVAPTNAPVLISGESGTGKELIAHAIHRLSNRTTAPFVKVNLGGLSSTLFESEMFGHTKGAYTDAISDRIGRFEMADTGTIFLDEIGELDMASQVKMLRVLEDQTFERLGESRSLSVDVRVISATNRDLRAQVERGLFREDLLYRINLIQVEAPPLRKRTGDIPALAGFFAGRAVESYRINMKKISAKGIEWLSQQPWPGNIRELKNVIERTVLLTQHDEIGPDDFIRTIKLGTGSADVRNNGPAPVGKLDEMEQILIRRTIEESGDNLSKAAKTLGISRATLYRRMEKYGILKEDKE